MRLDRVKNTKRNIIIGEIDKFISIMLPFIIRTMMLHFLGADYLGLNGLFYSVLQMLNLVELGFGTAITYSMYKPIADNDHAKINALLKLYKQIYTIIGIVTGILGLILMTFLPHLVKEEPPSDVNLYVVYLIFLANCCINCFLFPNRKALLAAFQREDICGRMHIVTYVVLYSVQIISVCLVKSYYLYAIMVPISSIIYSSLCAYKSKQIFGQYYEDGEIDDQTKKDIKKQVAGLMVRKIASYSRDAFDSMFVSAYLGLKAVAIYGNYYYVMDAVVILIGVIKTSMAGGIGNSIAMETVEKNHNDMKIINYMFMLISGWCAICLLCLYQPFMKIWVGEDMTLSFYFSILFAAYFYVLRMSDIRILYAEAIGIWWQGRYLSIIEAVANVLMNWIFIRHFGLLGIILSTMISFFLFNFIGGAIIIYIYYFKGCKISGYFMAQLKYLIVTLIVASVTCYATSLLNVNGIIEIIVKGIFCVVIPAVLYFLFYARTEDFKKARLLITQMLGIKKNK